MKLVHQQPSPIIFWMFPAEAQRLRGGSAGGWGQAQGTGRGKVVTSVEKSHQKSHQNGEFGWLMINVNTRSIEISLFSTRDWLESGMEFHRAHGKRQRAGSCQGICKGRNQAWGEVWRIRFHRFVWSPTHHLGLWTYEALGTQRGLTQILRPQLSAGSSKSLQPGFRWSWKTKMLSLAWQEGRSWQEGKGFDFQR